MCFSAYYVTLKHESLDTTEQPLPFFHDEDFSHYTLFAASCVSDARLNELPSWFVFVSLQMSLLSVLVLALLGAVFDIISLLQALGL